MPSQRTQSVISPKGLVTIPEPYRKYHRVQYKDQIIVRWNKIVILYPKNLETITALDEILMKALLEGRLNALGLRSIWKQLDTAEQARFLELVQGEEED